MDDDDERDDYINNFKSQSVIPLKPVLFTRIINNSIVQCNTLKGNLRCNNNHNQKKRIRMTMIMRMRTLKAP